MSFIVYTWLNKEKHCFIAMSSIYTLFSFFHILNSQRNYKISVACLTVNCLFTDTPLRALPIGNWKGIPCTDVNCHSTTGKTVDKTSIQIYIM